MTTFGLPRRELQVDYGSFRPFHRASVRVMLCRFADPSVLLFTLLLIAGGLSAAEPATESPGAAEPATEAAVYGEGVRSTPWQSGEDERAGFHLPPGFEIRLFASEPHIAKPLNMAFDRRGRMWVTQSVAYPYPAKAGEEAKDAVKILVDTDGDGAADQITTFADKLNIPIGVLPYGDGCLCFSIPNIWYLRDTDGDGKCDKREVVLGPFDTTRDTHGMINSLRDGGDGWIYACHGFNNQSKVAGSDGHVVSMQSGNTFRFRPDGSRIEHVTRGQVNPFGMTEDEWGYRYTADCHSKPITQLIRDACYPSFGRPHDGLGFLPPMVDHLHGSTAISGILYVAHDSPIKPLRGQMISGNVMTSRLNRNQLMFHGATAKGRELSDFLTSDDPWFRPVDIQLGSDGHIYVADFYNKIIGHYEVPLDHPGRDRTSGRIWQIRFTAAENTTSKPVLEDGDSCLSARREFIANPVQVSDSRLGELLTDDCPQVRVAAFRLAAERIGSESQQANFLDPARSAIADDNAHVVRAAAELLGLHGEQADIDLLHRRLPTVDEKDPVLRQTIRIAIRNLLRSTPSDDRNLVANTRRRSGFDSIGTDKARGVTAPIEIPFGPSRRRESRRIAFACRQTLAATIHWPTACESHARSPPGNPPSSSSCSMCSASLKTRDPDRFRSPLRDWALSLVDAELNAIDASEKLLAWSPTDGIHWPRESRKLRGGGEAMLVSSLGRGEQYTGKLVSDHFPAPDEIVIPTCRP